MIGVSVVSTCRVSGLFREEANLILLDCTMIEWRNLGVVLADTQKGNHMKENDALS